jgi:AcrR family transcriptional regulator
MQTTPASASVTELFGLTTPPRATRDRLLHAALELFYRYGFHEVGLDRVIDVVGVTKTTFYKHFESRDHLIMEAVALRDSRQGEAFVRCVREKAGDDPRATLLAMFEVLDEWFNEPAYAHCIFISACAEYPWRDHPVHRTAARFYERAVEEITEIAAAAGARNPTELAYSWVLLLQGALTQRMTLGDNSAAGRALPIAEALLASHAPLPAAVPQRG